MKKYHKSLDLVIAGAIAFSQGRAKEAANFFAAAADDPQFDKMVGEVSQEQEGLLDSPANGDSDLTKQQEQKAAAVAAFRRTLRRRAKAEAEATDDDGKEDDSDDEEEDDDATAEVEDPAEDDDSDADGANAVEEAARRVEANLRFVRRARK